VDNISIAREKLKVICSENFNDTTFTDYIEHTLAGDFIWEIVNYIEKETNRANAWVDATRMLANELGLSEEDSNGSIADWKFICNTSKKNG
jgi:hypothetical protein